MARKFWKEICADVKDTVMKLSLGKSLNEDERNQLVQFYLEVVSDAYEDEPNKEDSNEAV